MKKIFILILLLTGLGLVQQGNSQVIVTSVQNQTICEGELSVPILLNSNDALSAISLALEFDSSTLNYLAYTNEHPALNTGLFLVHTAGNTVYISWANVASAQFGNDTLLTLVFDALHGSSTLQWDTETPGNCEFSNVSGIAMPASFSNAVITVQKAPYFITTPQSQLAIVGQASSLAVQAGGTSLTYQWEVSSDLGASWMPLSNAFPYSGTTSATLSIAEASYAMELNWYRCRIEGVCPPVLYSDPLSIDVEEPPQEILVWTTPLAECPGMHLSPVYVHEFYGVGAFSMVLAFDDNLLDFIELQDLDPDLANGLFSVHATQGQLFLSWASSDTLNLSASDSLLFTIHWSSVDGGSTNLAFQNQLAGNCEISGTGGNPIPAQFQGSTLTVRQPPLITSQPQNVNQPEGSTAHFSIQAIGHSLTYQWELSTDGGTTFSPLFNNALYSGVTTSNLNVIQPDFTYHTYQFRCVVEGTCAPVAISNPVMLSIELPPQVIHVDAGDFTGCPDTFLIPITVAQFNSISALSLALNFDPTKMEFIGMENLHPNLNNGLSAANAINGQVLLTWASANETSLPNGEGVLCDLQFLGLSGGTISLTWDQSTPGYGEFTNSDTLIASLATAGTALIYGVPTIGAHPLSITRTAGENATFSVQASGTGLEYTWQQSTDGGINWQNLGTLGHTLSLSQVSLSMSGNLYRCVVSGTCNPPVVSGVATLIVNPPTQVIDLSLPNMNNLCAQQLFIPLTVQNFNQVGAFSLVIEYDSLSLDFQGLSNAHQALNSGLLYAHQVPGKVFVAWASTQAVSVGNGVLFDFLFVSGGGSTALNWDTSTPGNCEIVDANGNPILLTFTNGSITVSAQPLNVLAGPDFTLVPGMSAVLQGSVSGGTPPYIINWTPIQGLSNASLLQPEANPLQTTMYTLEVVDVSNCTSSDDAWVYVETIPSTGWMWARQQGGELQDETLALTADAAGNSYGSGYFSGDTCSIGNISLLNSGNTSLFLSKYDPYGEVLWAIASENEGWTEGRALAADDSGNVYLAGNFQHTFLELGGQMTDGYGWTDVFIAKISPQGSLIWLQSFGGVSQDQAVDVAIGPDGNVLLTGFFMSSTISFGSHQLSNTNTNFADIFLVKLNTGGDVLWAKKMGGTEWDEPADLHITANNDILLTGYFVSANLSLTGMNLVHSSGTQPNAFLARFDSQGNALWAKKPAISQFNYGEALTTDSIGNIYWTGQFGDASVQLGDSIFSSAGGSDLFLSKLAANGDYLWSVQAAGSGQESSAGLQSRNTNELVWVGNFNSTLLSIGNTSYGSAGFYDFFLVTLSAGGNVLTGTTVGNTLEERVHAVSGDVLGNVLVAGSYLSESLAFGNSTLQQVFPGEKNGFLAKFGETAPTLSVQANWSHPLCYDSNDGYIALTVVQGLPPFTYQWSHGATEASLENLSAGTYSVSVYDVNQDIWTQSFELISPLALEGGLVVQAPSCGTCPDGSIFATPAGGTPPYQLVWSTGATGLAIENLLPGWYSLSLTDANNCMVFLEVELPGILPTDTQYIDLPAGWSYFSTYLEPNSPNIADVLQPVVSYVTIAKSGGGGNYWPLYAINTIGDMQIGFGYQVHMTQAASLPVQGESVQPHLVGIELPLGWSILGYLHEEAMLADSMLISIAPAIEIVKDSNGLSYWPAWNINSIGNLKPGEGYLIKLNQAVVFYYPELSGQ